MPENRQEQLLEQSTVQYGTTPLDFIIKRSNRKTLTIEVHPDLSIQVIAPNKAANKDIEERVLKRGKWITTQQAYFEQFLPRSPEREYVSGESHFYLGRKYQLKIRASEERSVKLKGAELTVTLIDVNDKEIVKRLLNKWYHNHAQKRFDQTVKEALIKFKKFNLTEPPLQIKRMPKRWGSCTPNGKIILNPEIIKAPSKCIEYVVIHELCHLIQPNHNKAFYDLQSEMMPDWERWKMRLERILV